LNELFFFSSLLKELEAGEATSRKLHQHELFVQCKECGEAEALINYAKEALS
jgi:hypothetical protein